MPGLGSFSRPVTRLAAMGAGVLIASALSSCQPPFNLGQPTTRALESGAANVLSSASSLELAGTYTEGGHDWTIDTQMVRPSTQHSIVSTAGVQLEAIVVGDSAYFRGQQYLASHIGGDPLSQSLIKAAGNAWWRGAATTVPRLPDFTQGSSFQATFLGSVVNQRLDHVSVDGIDAVELSGPRADVYIATAQPYVPLRVRLKKGVAIDGVMNGDLRFSNFGRDFQIAVPADVIDFSNLSTLPPIYTVVSVDASRCGSTCAVSAVLKNLGGMSGARAPSTVTFTMTDSASGLVVGTCEVAVVPDVGYNATTTVGCTVQMNGQVANAAVINATPTNPGRA